MPFPLIWLGIGDDQRTALGPSNIKYRIEPDEIAVSLCRPGTAPVISCWYAYRDNVELNDEAVGLDEAIELAQADADELCPGDEAQLILAEPDAAHLDALNAASIAEREMRRAFLVPADVLDARRRRMTCDEPDVKASRLPTDFVDNDFDGLG